MSRTDKTRPARVRAVDPLDRSRRETHDHAPRRVYEYARRTTRSARTIVSRRWEDGHCDWEGDGRSLYWAPHESRWGAAPRCGWELEWWWSPKHPSTPPPSRSHLQRMWRDPERAHVRDTLHGMAREWNGNGDIENDDATPVRPAKRSPWYGGRWD